MTDAAELPLVAVTGSQKPYVFDLPHVLSLPQGFDFRFRYREQWISTDILAKIKTAPTSFRGRTLYLVFHSQENRRVFPLRKCTIREVEIFGSMVFIRFCVGPFMWLPDAQGSVSLFYPPGLPEEDPAQKLAQPLGEGQYLWPLKRDVPANFWTQDQRDVDAWANVARDVTNEPSLEGVPFFYLLGFQDGRGNTPKASPIEKGVAPRCAFAMTEGTRYRLRLLQWCDPKRRDGLLTCRVDCKANPDNFRLEGASDLVVGRYDVLEFSLVALKPGFSEIHLGARPYLLASPQEVGPRASMPEATPTATKPGNESEPWRTWPSIFASRVPVMVLHNRLRLLLLAVAAVAGAGTYFGGPAVYVRSGFGSEGPATEVFHLVGILLMWVALGEYLERFVRTASYAAKAGLGSGHGDPKAGA